MKPTTLLKHGRDTAKAQTAPLGANSLTIAAAPTATHTQGRGCYKMPPYNMDLVSMITVINGLRLQMQGAERLADALNRSDDMYNFGSAASQLEDVQDCISQVLEGL